MKKILHKLCTAMVLLSLMMSICVITSAETGGSEPIVTIQEYEDGSYLETILVEEPGWDSGIAPLGWDTKTASKTSYYKNASGETMWSITVSGHFAFDGNMAICNSSEYSYTDPSPYWSIISITADHRANYAVTNAVARFSSALSTYDYDASVSLHCSPNGELT